MDEREDTAEVKAYIKRHGHRPTDCRHCHTPVRIRRMFFSVFCSATCEAAHEAKKALEVDATDT